VLPFTLPFSKAHTHNTLTAGLHQTVRPNVTYDAESWKNVKRWRTIALDTTEWVSGMREATAKLKGP
jgi:hypothetical protein